MSWTSTVTQYRSAYYKDPMPTCALVCALFAMAVMTMSSQSRPRARDIGIAPGMMEPGPHNAITDVAGVRVGHTTIVTGDNVAPA